MFSRMPRPFLSRLVRVWLVIAAVDGVCASALSVVAYGSTVTRLWQGVAGTVLGPRALDGGWRTALVGVLLHLGVALGWSTVFLALATASPRLRRAIATSGGGLAVAAVYGPVVWLVMSLAVIPLLTGRPPTPTQGWWVQLVAHVPFVALPIVAMTARETAADRSP